MSLSFILKIDADEIDKQIAATKAKVERLETDVKEKTRVLKAHLLGAVQTMWGWIGDVLDKAGVSFAETINSSISVLSTLISTAYSAATTWSAVPGGQAFAALEIANAGVMLMQQQLARSTGATIQATINQAGDDFTLK